jgi:uncharacterized protein involved in outer membrane biogenesis
MQSAIGDTAIAGDVNIGFRADPARIRASLVAKTLDVEEFLRRLDQRAAAPAKPAGQSGRLFDDTRISLDLPRRIDAEIGVHVDKLRYGATELDGVTLTANFDDRMVTLKPLRFGMGGGTVTGEFTIDERTGTPRVTTALVGRGLDPNRILRGAAIAPFVKGRIDAAVDVKTSGTTSRALAKGLAGKVGIEMASGQLDNGYFTVLSSDVLRVLTPWAPREEAVRINCMMTVLDLQQGVGTSRVALLDTSHAMIVVDGTVDLADESLSFAVWPRAKDVSLMRLMVPLRVSGPLASPSVYPDPARLIPGAVGIVTGIFEGLGSLIGIGNDAKGTNRCRAALAAVMKKSVGDKSIAPKGLFPDTAPQ